MNIIIKRISSLDALSLAVTSTDTIEHVKNLIQEHLAVNVHAQHLVRGRTPLEDDCKSLEDYDIADGSEVMLLVVEVKCPFIYPNGDVYDGELQDGKAHGHGTYTSKQSKYVGEWQSDSKHGQAVEEWDDTSKYTGTYSDGQKHGKGRFEWPDGSVYDGEFRNNNVEGDGTFTWEDGRQYRGQFVNKQMHGEGRYEWPDGRAYEGEYYHDLKEGEGTFLWPDRRKFTGQWKDGKQHGVGVFRTAKGAQRTGQWREGVRVSWDDATPNVDGNMAN